MLSTRTLLLPFITTYVVSFAVVALLWNYTGLAPADGTPASGLWILIVIGVGLTSLAVLALLMEYRIRRPLQRHHEQLAADRQERESRLRLFASAVTAADDAIAIINSSGGLSYLNPAFEQLTGFSTGELMTSSNWWKLVFADYEMDPRAFGTEQWDGNAHISRADGKTCLVEATTYLLDDAAVDNPHYVLLMRDVTERNRQLEHMQELATAVVNIEDCIIIADVAGAIRYANPAYEKRCGAPLADMLGQEINSLQHASSPPEVYAELRNTLLSGKAWRGELQATFSDGRRVIEEAIVSPVTDAKGQILNYVTTLHDVTDRVRMEKDLRLATDRIQKVNDDLEHRVQERTEELRDAKEAAEAANSAKSAFLATVSHEIRTPLNGILGMLELLADHPLQPQQKSLLNSADTSAGLLLSLINDILDFSKIEAGQLQLEETPVSLREVTESVLLSLAPAAHRQDIRLQSLLHPELPASIKLDGVRLQQVLLNLLGNAVKFTGTVTDRDRRVTLQVEPQMNEDLPFLCFKVSDNGVGIPQEALGNLFLPFTQAESSTTRRFGGTGLGLSISSRLVRLMGGEISVISTLGEGSTFTVLLPLQEAASAEAVKLPPLPLQRTEDSAAQSWNADAPRGKILIAEDNAINQEVIRLQLKAIGFDSDVAADGQAALEMWRTQRYDLVLTDCHMPNMDGFALARAIRAEEGTQKRMPIIALTANVLSEEATRCREAGMDECLTKPIQRKRLDKALTVQLTASALRDRAAVKQTSYSPSTSAPAATPSQGCLLNMQIFADHLGCDITTQHDLLRRLAEDSTAMQSDCSRAFNHRDADTLGCTAHKLKSAARTVGAERLAELCVNVEAASEATDWASLASLLDDLTVMLDQLRHEIDGEVVLTGASIDQPQPADLAGQDA